ncbi:MAG: hypothetical protein A3C27_02760 [Candidatus Levybacteria bacterium RIFCSPHIGHO2_02_FULL_39_36]|nr:MAG: hypothetical protein UT56_C0010G0011 [Candidatus Levybacteria bacterium GW2011_GWB1_39_7]KKR49535.1 MAG: hypothetical protein UT85_C0016G0012 [Candidatus Levybacteria bacterium GW2011_GWA2_40_16]OGH26041.1 MAG: hypothetical protein A3E68_01925 [Candidatus Levybacteria bacterium RIFCSPHIGHO2_12_FULL_39_39]OGH27545.1 MAG: hypothetical protein A3C27_02760 [Candidatus Levybacteria bacterium RIFCSPHIGHO2_02_FULL_39_36]OGH45352.1 MAG: hypothetical protein A3H82_00410 [Candidatus Levybacteria 
MGTLSKDQRSTPIKSGSKTKNQKLFILHGWTYSTDKWDPFLKILKRNDYELELLKIPGLTEPLDEAWDISDYVQWINAKIGEKKTTLIGHSNGGRVAMAFALKYPNKIEKLILIDSAGIRDKKLSTKLKRFIFYRLAKFGKNITSSVFLKDLLYKSAGEKDYELATPIMKQTMNNLISFDLEPHLSEIRIPTLIIWGEKDKITPLYFAEIINKQIRNSKLIVVRGAKHSPQFTHPKEVFNCISNFILKQFN